MAAQIEADDRPPVTTRAVLVEMGNALSKLRYRASAITLLYALEDDRRVEVVPLSEELHGRGLEIYRRHQDEEWGMTDCISFAVMQQRSVANALTADDHFRQAGFRPLLAAG